MSEQQPPTATSAPPGAADTPERRERAFREAVARVEALDQGAPRRAHGRDKFALFVMIVLLAIGWAHTFHEMWFRWFEAWRHTHLPLWDRLTEGDSYYTHGPMVPVVALLLAWFIFRPKKIGLPTRCTRRSNLAGGVMLGMSLFVQLFAARADVMFLSGFALLGVIASLVMLWGGTPLLRAYWLPIAVLIFMIPLPMDAIAKLNYQLKYFATEQALWLTQNVFGIPAILDGSEVLLKPGPDGKPKILVVENVCGGLRSLISLTFFAALFAIVCRATGWWRLLILLLALPVAVMSNILRITSMNVVAHHWTVADAGEGSTFHDMSGIMVFVVALALLFGVEQVILKIGHLLKRDWGDNRLLGYLDHLAKLRGPLPRVYRPVVMCSVAATVALSVWFSFDDPKFNRGNVAAGAIPKTLVVDGVACAGTDTELDDLSLAILQTDDYLFRHFTGEQTRFNVLIVFSPNNRKGTHPPEVCLEGSGNDIVGKRAFVLDDVVAGKRLRMRELIASGDTHENYHAYVYKCGSRYTNSYLIQQLLIFVNGLIESNSAGALIRFDVPVERGDVESARALARHVIREVMPMIDAEMP